MNRIIRKKSNTNQTFPLMIVVLKAKILGKLNGLTRFRAEPLAKIKKRGGESKKEEE